jgi:hypothetical protein
MSSFPAKVSSAIPAHLKLGAMGNGQADAGVERKHHGKSQSHMVSSNHSLINGCSCTTGDTRRDAGP